VGLSPFNPVALIQAVPARILKPRHEATFRVALQHEWAIVMTDDQIHQSIPRDVDGNDSDRGVEVADLVAFPC
jgi:hypothetical protein